MAHPPLPDSGIRELTLWLLRQRRRFRVTGVSMLPLLQPGDLVLINHKAYCDRFPEPGDLVVARHPDRPNLLLVKRVAAVLDDGQCILIGDNPAESTDSRSFGAVSLDLILGCVTSVIKLPH